jgi:hypothetical protein
MYKTTEVVFSPKTDFHQRGRVEIFYNMKGCKLEN